MQRGAYEGEHERRPLRLQLLRDQAVEPARVELVEQIVLRLEELDQVLDGGAEVAADGELLEREHHVFARVLARLAPREAVAELGVGELVQTAARAHTEVAPDVAARPEVELGDGAAARLEALLGVLAGDARRYHVALRLRLVGRLVKVDATVAVGRLAVEHADVFDPLERQTHRDL